MERIGFIVDRLNHYPFNKGYSALTDLHSKPFFEMLDISLEVLVAINKDYESVLNDTFDAKVNALLSFLTDMKFDFQNSSWEDIKSYIEQEDIEILISILFWCLQKFEHLKKRSYLAKYLKPLNIPPEFLGEPLVYELQENLKQLQGDFKEIHKVYDQTANKPFKQADIIAEIEQLEREKKQLTDKINKMKKEFKGDNSNFQDMLKATSLLRREQEEELRLYERVRTYRTSLDESEVRLNEAKRKLAEMKQSGAQNQTAEQIYNKLADLVRAASERKEALEISTTEKEIHLEKLIDWENQAGGSEDDVRSKRDQVADAQEQFNSLKERLDSALERNQKLSVFRQASTMAVKKLREKEEECNKLVDEKARIKRQADERISELRAQGKTVNRDLKTELQTYGAVVRNKIETYKRMREELSSVRAELVILQRTEQLLKTRDKNLDDFMSEQERKKGIVGYRDTQNALVEMTEKAAEIDKMKGATLEEISKMVDQINREFKSKQSQLQPLMTELKSCKQEFNDVEGTYLDKKGSYDKVAISLDMEKQALDKDCDICQEDCLREETRYHTLTNMINIAKIKLERAEMEKKWRNGAGKLSRDVSSFKECYADKIQRQEASIKRLRLIQKETKENHVHLANQKVNFNNLKYILDAKMMCANGDFDSLSQLQNSNGGGGGLSLTNNNSSSSSMGGAGGGGGGQASFAAPSKSTKNFSIGGANVMNFDD